MIVGSTSQELPNECLINETLLVYMLQDNQRNEWFYSPLQKLTITVFLPIISVFGLIGNSALLIIIARIRGMRTITNFYLGNLAVSDLLFVFVALISYVRLYYVSNGLFVVDNISSPVMCVLHEFSLHIFYFASVGFVVLVSSERFYAVCCPIRYRILNHSKKRALKYVIFTWTIAVIVTFLVLPAAVKVNYFCVVWDTNGTYDKLSYCSSYASVFTYLHALTDVLYFFLALGASSVFYLMIVIKLRQRQVSSTLYSISQQAKSTRNQVSRMVIINGVVFFSCLAPFPIYSMYIYRGGAFLTPGQANTLKWTACLLESINSSVNPIIYTAANYKYREAFLQLFCYGGKLKHHRPVRDLTVNQVTEL